MGSNSLAFTSDNFDHLTFLSLSNQPSRHSSNHSFNYSHHRLSPNQQLLSHVDKQHLSLAQRQWWSLEDSKWMQQALKCAVQGAQLGEVPVGAVLVQEGKLIGEGFNQPIMRHDPTCHAEIVALRQACEALNNYRLPPGTTLYVTLEPCTMCIGALIHARLSRLIFATKEPRAGMLGSQLNLADCDFYNHKIDVMGGLFAMDSSQLLKKFFKQRRQSRNN